MSTEHGIALLQTPQTKALESSPWRLAATTAVSQSIIATHKRLRKFKRYLEEYFTTTMATSKFQKGPDLKRFMVSVNSILYIV
jgi:hypothetical protein